MHLGQKADVILMRVACGYRDHVYNPELELFEAPALLRAVGLFDIDDYLV